jgi:uncharacterized membrane protein (UPF0127 family)
MKTPDAGDEVPAYVIFTDGTRIRVDVADTDAARARGLMFRPPLADDEGMLFVFDVPGRYGFWMKNVRGPLDIVWLDSTARVVWMVENAPPCDADPCPTYAPPREASFVLEVAGGAVRRRNVAVGDIVTISLPRSSSSRRATRGRC